MAKSRELEEIRSEIKKYEAIINPLCNVSASEALASLERLRLADSPTAFLSEARSRQLPLRPQLQNTQLGMSVDALGNSLQLLGCYVRYCISRCFLQSLFAVTSN